MEKTERLTVGALGAALTDKEIPRQALPNDRICSALVDSRLVGPGSLFVALRGEHVDGHDYIGQALTRGAIAIIAERLPAGLNCTVLDTKERPFSLDPSTLVTPICFLVPDSLLALQQAAAYWRRQHEVRVIGITGSLGKTTSKEIIDAVLARRYHTLKSRGNYNNEVGLPLTLLDLNPNHERVILEMGMYDLGEIAALAEIALPQVGVVTNVGPSHLERLGSIERIAQAKAELPQALPPAAKGGVAILNADDHRVRAMSDQTPAQVFTYGLTTDATLWADEIASEGLEGIRFQMHYAAENLYTSVPLLGRHSVHTALCASAVGLVEGLSWEEIIAGLRDQSAQLRLVAVPGPNNSTILDDTYNASPASSIAALNLLTEVKGRKVAVLGEMYELGGYEQEAHKLVGRRARDVADLLVTVGPLGLLIAEEALQAGMSRKMVHTVDTNAQAIDLLRELIEPGPPEDVVLVKGSRGMEMEEIVAALQQGEPT